MTQIIKERLLKRYLWVDWVSYLTGINKLFSNNRRNLVFISLYNFKILDYEKYIMVSGSHLYCRMAFRNFRNNPWNQHRIFSTCITGHRDHCDFI